MTSVGGRRFMLSLAGGIFGTIAVQQGAAGDFGAATLVVVGVLAMVLGMPPDGEASK